MKKILLMVFTSAVLMTVLTCASGGGGGAGFPPAGYSEITVVNTTSSFNYRYQIKAENSEKSYAEFKLTRKNNRRTVRVPNGNYRIGYRFEWDSVLDKMLSPTSSTYNTWGQILPLQDHQVICGVTGDTNSILRLEQFTRNGEEDWSEIAIKNENKDMSISITDTGNKFKVYGGSVKEGDTFRMNVLNGNYTISAGGVLRVTYNTRSEGNIKIEPNKESIYLTIINTDTEDTKTNVLVLESRTAYIGSVQKVSQAHLKNAKEIIKNLDKQLAPKAKKQARVAFFPLAARSGIDATVLFDAMSIELVNTQNYSVIEKQMLDAVLAEHDFQLSNAVGYRTIGQLLEADIVVFGIVRPRGVELVAIDVNKFTLLATSRK